MNPQKVYIKPFRLCNQTTPYPTILIVGKRFSGKSTITCNIAYNLNLPKWTAWCGTKDTESYWADRFGTKATVHGIDHKGVQKLNEIVAWADTTEGNRSILGNPHKRQQNGVGMIFDDVTSNKDFTKNKILDDLFSNGRHYKCAIIICCQYLKQLPPSVRTNTDYIFMMHNTKKTAKMLHEEFVENPHECTLFLKLLQSVTGQKSKDGTFMYNALVYSNIVNTHKLDEMFFSYRADKHASETKLGHPAWRQYNRLHFTDKFAADTKKKDRDKKQRLRIDESEEEWSSHVLQKKKDTRDIRIMLKF